MRYRITFTPKHKNQRTKTYDVTADNSDQAFKIAYQKLETKSGKYTSIGVQAIPEGAKNIGIHFQYTDLTNKKTYSDYLIIRALTETQAKNYYQENLQGKRYWFTAGEIREDGKHQYGKILDTYLAACPGYKIDATINTTITHETAR